MKLYLYFGIKVESYGFNYMLSFALLEAADFSRAVKSINYYVTDLFRFVFLEIESCIQKKGNKKREMCVDLRARMNLFKLLQGNSKLNWGIVCLQRL